MAGDLILTVDVGTSGCKTVLFTRDGEIIDRAYEEYDILYPQPGWAEQDPETWWRAVVHNVRAIGARQDVVSRVAAVCVSSQREGLVPVDIGGRPLSRCIIWMDQRTGTEAEEIAGLIDPGTLADLTGMRLNPAFSIAKLRWIQKNQPEIHKAAHKFLQVADYVNHRLTGRFISDHSMASRTMLMNVCKLSWAWEIFGRLGLDAGQMPELVAPGVVLGSLTKQSAAELGLSTDTAVVAGGGDQQCGALGAGVVDDTTISVSLGTSSALSLTLNEPRMDPEARIPCCCAALPGRWEWEPPIWTSGVILRWYRDVFAGKEAATARTRGIDPYEILSEQAAAVEPGCEGLFLLPYFAGAGAPGWDANAKGVLYGLTLRHGRGHIVRAIMEGVACEVAWNIEIIGQLGARPRELRVLGGGARSGVWLRIMAGVTGLPVSVPRTEEAASLGTAILAATALGWHMDHGAAVRAMGGTKLSLAPDNASRCVYEQSFAAYKRLAEAMRGFREGKEKTNAAR